MSRTISHKPRTATARWPLHLLLDTLRRQGWGPLAGKPWKGLRATLQGLAARLPYGSAQGPTTIEQIASASGYGMRWTRQCLTDLEDLGLITWQRGGVRYGRPVPSVFRINKHMLAELVEAAREQRTAALIEWAARTRSRLERIRTIRMVKGKRRTHPAPTNPRTPNDDRKTRRPPHAAVSTDPSLKRGNPKGLHPSAQDSPTPTRPAPALPASLESLTGPALARAVLASIRHK